MNQTNSSTRPSNRLLLLLFIALLFVGNAIGSGTFTLMAAVLILPWVIGFAGLATVHLVLIFLAARLAAEVLPAASTALAIKPVGMLIYFYVVMLVPSLRKSMGWLRPGRFDIGSFMMVMVIIVISAGAVISWTHWMPQSAAIRNRILPADIPRHLVPIYMGAFAMANALIEEITWRGVEMTALDGAFGAGIFSLLVQGFQFGFAHFHGGFPNGWTGALMASAFGIALGWLRRRSRGLLAPWCAHVAVDFTIACLVFYGVGMK